MVKSIRGIVKKHLGRGAKLGYPTANIEISADAEEGVFLGYTRISLPPLSSPPSLREGEKERGLPSLIFIGSPETFSEVDKRLEVHILDFAGDLYGEEIVVEIIHKLRENTKFESEEALIEQMKIDEREARKYFFKISLPKFASGGGG